MAIPKKFNQDGLLNPGTYTAAFKELRESILVEGTGESQTWDKNWRKQLVNQLEILVQQLWNAKNDQIFIDGSFVEDKDHPNDIDGYFDPNLNIDTNEGMLSFEKLVSDLNEMNRHRVWRWDPESRIRHSGIAKLQLPMWHFYRIELYPHLKQNSGIKDRFGNDLQFPSAFRQSRNGKSKGIVQLIQ